MSLIDVAYPEGALEPPARARAVERLTAALLHHEGAQDTERTRAITWCTVHELPADAVHVGGAPVETPFYRVHVVVPEGTLLHGPGPVGAGARSNLVREVTEILLEAEGTAYSASEAGRVVCLIDEVKDGFWGSFGTAFRMEDIHSFTSLEAPDSPIADQGQRALDAMLREAEHHHSNAHSHH
jgi:phenylpyruvate tautomerase PptA (4-oxalocrotonate tautomerase family)